MVWPTLGSRKAKEQNSSIYLISVEIYVCTFMCVRVCVEGHCSEFKVIADGDAAATFSIERETAAVVLDREIDQETTPFFMFNVVANCSSADNLSTVIQTQVGQMIHE